MIVSQDGASIGRASAIHRKLDPQVRASSASRRVLARRTSFHRHVGAQRGHVSAHDGPGRAHFTNLTHWVETVKKIGAPSG
jgi:hypothetical protein